MEKTLTETFQGPITRWIRYWLPVVGYASLIFYLSSLPHPEEDLPKFLFEKFSDKVLHLIEYAVLASLCYRAFWYASGPCVSQHVFLLAILSASFYGMTDEIHQAFVPFRESSVVDWLADTAGAALGAIGSRRIMKCGTEVGFS